MPVRLQAQQWLANNGATLRWSLTFLFWFCYRKDYENHMLQSRLHFRIHSALQEIKHIQKQAKAASKRDKRPRKNSKENKIDNTSPIDEDSISVSMEDWSDHDSEDASSSFETAPEDSGPEDDGGLGLIATDSTPNQSIRRETAV